jgi:hypothetical protein
VGRDAGELAVAVTNRTRLIGVSNPKSTGHISTEPDLVAAE